MIASVSPPEKRPVSLGMSSISTDVYLYARLSCQSSSVVRKASALLAAVAFIAFDNTEGD